MLGEAVTGALVGGALIGLASALVLLRFHSVAGVSGILGGLLSQRGDAFRWRMAFIVGLVSAGVVAGSVAPSSVRLQGAPDLPALIAAGLLVGFGTRLSNGCTSGHGVCGVGRMSPRSIVATLTFMVVGAVTVFVVRHMLAAGG